MTGHRSLTTPPFYVLYTFNRQHINYNSTLVSKQLFCSASAYNAYISIHSDISQSIKVDFTLQFRMSTNQAAEQQQNNNKNLDYKSILWQNILIFNFQSPILHSLCTESEYAMHLCFCVLSTNTVIMLGTHCNCHIPYSVCHYLSVTNWSYLVPAAVLTPSLTDWK